MYFKMEQVSVPKGNSMADVSIPAWCHPTGGRAVNGWYVLDCVVDEQLGASQELVRPTMTTKCCP